MTILGAASAFPPHLYSQQTLTQAFNQHWADRLVRPALLERFHSRAGVRQRYLAYPIERYPEIRRWGDANRAWFDAASKLGEQALDDALRRSGLNRRDLDALYVLSVTGVASPSLDARLINQMGLRADLKRTPIFGLGCVGGAAGLTRAADYVRGFPDQTAAVLAVEICSVTLQPDDLSDVNLIATGLFADGAAAVVLGGSSRPASGPVVTATRSVFYPDSEDVMGWEISEAGFRIVLSRELPKLILERLGSDVDAFLNFHGLNRSAIGCWIVHPGGPRIIDAVQSALELRESDLALARECLAEAGNFSSGSVLYELEQVLDRQPPAPGTWALLLAMGPGFCAELVLIRW